MQTWTSVELIYPMVTKDYGLKPVKPVLMAEGAYEAGSEYGFDVTPLWVRRQAYYSYLAGGHHTYGHNDSWRVLPTWKQALDAPGAVQTGHSQEDLHWPAGEWWRLVPDQSVFASGGNTEGRRAPPGRPPRRTVNGLMVYLAEKATFSVTWTSWAAAKCQCLLGRSADRRSAAHRHGRQRGPEVVLHARRLGRRDLDFRGPTMTSPAMTTSEQLRDILRRGPADGRPGRRGGFAAATGLYGAPGCGCGASTAARSTGSA